MLSDKDEPSAHFLSFGGEMPELIVIYTHLVFIIL